MGADLILSELSQLLHRYGYEDTASMVRSLVDAPATEEFWQTLSGLEFWGGSGAVWEVEPFHLSHPHREGSADDYRRFQVLLIDLADILESKGLSGGAARTAGLFRQQLDDSS